MADIRRMPFTEIFEKVQRDLVRDNATTASGEAKYKGRVNDVYTVDIPSQIDWRHIRTIGSITTTDDYSTGYVATASGTSITGSGTTWTAGNSNTMTIKVSGYDETYICTYTSTTGGVVLVTDRTWIGDAIATNTGYTLFQTKYALASDYDRLILDPDKSVYYLDQGNKIYLKYKNPEEFESKQTVVPNDPAYYTVKWDNGDPYLYIDPPDNQARTIFYIYIPTLKRLSEYTTGTIFTLANGGTAVTGASTNFDGFVTDTTNYDYYFRIDGDGVASASTWYKIASASSDTALTLSDAYVGTAVSAGSAAYTISMVSRLPSGLDQAIMYGAALTSAVDQTNAKQMEGWSALYNKILEPYRSIEGKLDYGKQRLKTVYEKYGCRR